MSDDSAIDLYLALMKKCLTRTLHDDDFSLNRRTGTVHPRNMELREVGRDFPSAAETMIGLRRLDNLHRCIADIVARDIPGDLIETGVWRGGATIFMRAALNAYGAHDRNVWVADSFAGLPPPDVEHFPIDARSKLHTFPILSVSLEEVQANFSRYGLLDDNVRFLVGWFRDTLPTAPITHLAILRLDGDLYESTMEALEALYPKLSVGGYVIVDDYGSAGTCRRAVENFRAAQGIDDPLIPIDQDSVYWERRHRLATPAHEPTPAIAHASTLG